jgi:hypothetical protein
MSTLSTAYRAIKYIVDIDMHYHVVTDDWELPQILVTEISITTTTNRRFILYSTQHTRTRGHTQQIYSWGEIVRW